MTPAKAFARRGHRPQGETEWRAYWRANPAEAEEVAAAVLAVVREVAATVGGEAPRPDLDRVARRCPPELRYDFDDRRTG